MVYLLVCSQLFSFDSKIPVQLVSQLHTHLILCLKIFLNCYEKKEFFKGHFYDSRVLNIETNFIITVYKVGHA